MRELDRVKINRPPRDRRKEAIFTTWLGMCNHSGSQVQTLSAFIASCDAGEVHGFEPVDASTSGP